MKNYSFAGLLVAVGCLAACGGSFGDAPGSSGAGSSDGGSGQTNGGSGTNGDTDSGGGVSNLDGGSVDPGPTFSFVPADGPVQVVVQEQPATIPIAIHRGITPGTNIKIDITSAPDGISPVGTLTILPGSNTGSLLLSVGATSPQGDVTVKLRGLADGATIPVTMDLQLFVRGKPGALDTTFAPGGVIENTLNDYFSIGDIVPQSDGKILIGANGGNGGTSAVIRLNADGLVDSTLTDTPIQKISGILGGVAAYPDGRILTLRVGTIDRYTAAGVPDPTFSSVVTTASPPTGWDVVSLSTIALGPNDSIYAGGVIYFNWNKPGNSFPYAFRQFPADGVPGCTGVWNNDQDLNFIRKLFLLPTGAFAGSLAFAGTAVMNGLGSGKGIGVGRYKQPSSCTLDPNYGNNAENKGTWYSTDWKYLSDVLFETDGSVDLLAGTSTSARSLVRISKDGQQATYVDLPLYNGNGITRTSNGRYLIAGQYEDSTTGNTSMAIVYYNSGLTIDTTIGDQNGIVTIPVTTNLTGSNVTGLRAVYMPDNSRTVVVGSVSGKNADGNSVTHLVVARIWN
ncbi:MAG: delta-60 repeat domain-containing protein [Polyangiaceae bacterium]|nr:delta-60 repeat domain-containing protein [Polyangiaceae bacterium]